MDFSNYKFRASQVHLLMTGTIGLTDKKEERRLELITRKNGAEMQEKDSNGKTIKPLTPNMENELKELETAKNDQSLPKTMQNELRKIWRAEKYKRNFIFTNKYVQKGILQEEEAITLFQEYRNKVLGEKTFFTKNTERLENDFFSGEWDLPTLPEIQKNGIGFDIKNSWSLDTFPFAEDELDSNYYWQNQVYMDLTGAEKWQTVYCLVNGTEHLVNNEKQKHFYALNMPNEEDDLYQELIKKQRDIEKMMIYDYDRFVTVNPFHVMEISKKEWFANGYDIPLKDKVLIKEVSKDEDSLNELKNRINIARKYLNSLNK